MLQLVNQTKEFDLNYYVINHQLFGKAYIILCDLRKTNLQILSTKTLPGHLIPDCCRKNEIKIKKEKRKIQIIFTSIYREF